MPKLYDSEFTLFMREWLKQRPEQREVQRTGCAIWRDKPQDARVRRGYEDARVAAKPCCHDHDVAR
ncbi:MAG: DUF3460 family protein [Azoarcus sp.]|nr:DUF3460 family protein [Azoarcus sp.]